MKKAIPIIVAVVGCLAIGGLSGIATADAINNWYVNVNKPSFNPPNWVFGPVWTALYAMMGIALGLVYNSTTPLSKTKAYSFFGIQLLLNGLWSILFFSMQNPAMAMVDILILLVFIGLSIKSFAPFSKTAAWLLIPYILWVTFASVLNAFIWYLN